MKKENIEKLKTLYPQLLKDSSIECNDGWYNLINDSLKRLSKIDNKCQVISIKIDLGGMKIFLSKYSDEMDKAIEIFENKSYTICENCGSKLPEASSDECVDDGVSCYSCGRGD